MAPEYVFDCPECTAQVIVDADIRSELLTTGCVLCETPVSSNAFLRATDACRSE
ncbi:DUF7560 family zinc ribbon protein [Halorussus marinus]